LAGAMMSHRWERRVGVVPGEARRSPGHTNK